MAVFCLYKSQKKPTRRYPFGYGKLETIGSVGISIMLLCTSFGIIVHSSGRLAGYIPSAWLHGAGLHLSWLWSIIRPLLDHRHSHGYGDGFVHTHGFESASPGMQEPSNSIALFFVLTGILTKEGLYHFTYRMARQTRSSVLEVCKPQLTQASAYHHRMEAVGSLGSFLAIAGAWLGFPILDPLGGLFLALLYGRGAWRLLLTALQQLCDRSVSDDLYLAIQSAFDEAIVETKVYATPPCEYSALSAISSGPYVVVHATLHFAPHIRLADALATEQRVSDSVRAAIPAVR